jgi:hypothetical protein
MASEQALRQLSLSISAQPFWRHASSPPFYEGCSMDKSLLNALSAGLSHADALCLYVTVEFLYLKLVLRQIAERKSQLAIACELLQRARAELARA